MPAECIRRQFNGGPADSSQGVCLRKEIALLFPAAVVLSILALTVLAAPSVALTTTIAPGQTFIVTYPAEAGDSIAYHWTVSESVGFSISNPSGDLIFETTAAQHSGIREVTEAGDYMLLWTNHRSTSVDLTYEVTVLPFHVGGTPLIGFLAAISIVIIVIVIIVLIIFVVFRDDRRRMEELYRQQQAYYLVPPTLPPTPEGKCSRCGALVRPGSRYCEKCGVRVR